MSSRTTADRDYFTQLFEAHHRALYAYAYKKTKDRFVAEEIAQTSFIKFWQHHIKATTTKQGQPEKLLFFIAKALLVDHFRKKTTTVSIEVLTAKEVPDNSLVHYQESLHFKNIVRAAAGTLPNRQKQIFELNYFSQLDHGEIASELNISLQTVKNQLSKAMKQVQKLTAQQFLSTFTLLL